jgi:hypothetical protein
VVRFRAVDKLLSDERSRQSEHASRRYWRPGSGASAQDAGRLVRRQLDRALGGVDPSEAVVRGGPPSYVIPAAHLCEAHKSAAVADHVPLVDVAPAIGEERGVSACSERRAMRSGR